MGITDQLQALKKSDTRNNAVLSKIDDILKGHTRDIFNLEKKLEKHLKQIEKLGNKMEKRALEIEELERRFDQM